MQTEVAAALLSIVHLSLAALSAGHALLDKREPRAAIGWIAVSFSVPFIGPIANYMALTTRRRRRHNCAISRLDRGVWRIT